MINKLEKEKEINDGKDGWGSGKVKAAWADMKEGKMDKLTLKK